MEGFRGCFADLVDPRRGNAQRHELDEIVMVALLAMVSSAETCVDMALYGRSTEALLRRFLRLPGGIPSHDTSRGCSGCSIPRPSRCASHATWRHSPSGFRGWSRSTARRCATPATASKTRAPASDQRLRLRHAAGARAAQGRRHVQRDHRLARASGPLDTGWLLPRGGKRFSSAAATMCSPSRATRRRSSRTSSCCSTIPMPCSTMWRRRSTAIMAGSRPAGSRPAGARSSTTRPGSPNGTASLASRTATTSCPRPSRPRASRRRPRPLARREPSALGSRRRHGRGPRPQGPRTREPRPIAPLRAQHPPRQPGQRLHGSLLQNF
jgi:hypothetical protein